MYSTSFTINLCIYVTFMAAWQANIRCRFNLKTVIIGRPLPVICSVEHRHSIWLIWLQGFMMKLDAFHHIQQDTVYRGMYRVSWDEVLEEYSGFHVPVRKMNQFHGSVRLPDIDAATDYCSHSLKADVCTHILGTNYKPKYFVYNHKMNHLVCVVFLHNLETRQLHSFQKSKY